MSKINKKLNILKEKDTLLYDLQEKLRGAFQKENVTNCEKVHNFLDPPPRIMWTTLKLGEIWTSLVS